MERLIKEQPAARGRTLQGAHAVRAGFLRYVTAHRAGSTNELKSEKAGKPGPFMVGQPYVYSARLLAAKATSDFVYSYRRPSRAA